MRMGEFKTHLWQEWTGIFGFEVLKGKPKTFTLALWGEE
jgi:hypothetical protein